MKNVGRYQARAPFEPLYCSSSLYLLCDLPCTVSSRFPCLSLPLRQGTYVSGSLSNYYRLRNYPLERQHRSKCHTITNRIIVVISDKLTFGPDVSTLARHHVQPCHGAPPTMMLGHNLCLHTLITRTRYCFIRHHRTRRDHDN